MWSRSIRLRTESREQVNEPSDSIKGRASIQYLSGYWLLKKNSVQRHYNNTECALNNTNTATR
jgi:hypothetical protein